MSTEQKIKSKIMAAAYAAAAELGHNEAIKLLEQAAESLRKEQWVRAGSR